MLAASMASADLAPPPERPKEADGTKVPLRVVRQTSGPTKLVIPQRFRSKFQAPRRGSTGLLWPMGFQTLIAGLALSLAVVTSGYLLLRRRVGQQRRQAAGAIAAVSVIVVFATFASQFAWGDLAPPPRPVPPRSTNSSLVVEYTSRGDAVELHISAADLARLNGNRGRGDGAKKTSAAPVRSAPPAAAAPPR